MFLLRFLPFFIPVKSFESGSPRKFIPAKFFIRRHPRKFIPAKCKYFAVFLNRESFFPRKFLPLKYETNLRLAILHKKFPNKKFINKRLGRPCLLGEKLHNLVQNYLKVTRYNGGVFNTSVAIATANSFRRRYSLLEKENDILNRSWVQSLFHPIGFVIGIVEDAP